MATSAFAGSHDHALRPSAATNAADCAPATRRERDIHAVNAILATNSGKNNSAAGKWQNSSAAWAADPSSQSRAIRTACMDRRRRATGRGLVFSLVGPSGPSGPSGPQGPAGNGIDGASGPSGPAGPRDEHHSPHALDRCIHAHHSDTDTTEYFLLDQTNGTNITVTILTCNSAAKGTVVGIVKLDDQRERLIHAQREVRRCGLHRLGSEDNCNQDRGAFNTKQGYACDGNHNWWPIFW